MKKVEKKTLLTGLVAAIIVVFSMSFVVLQNTAPAQTGLATNTETETQIASQSQPVTPTTMTMSVGFEQDIYGRRISLLSSTGSQILVRVGSVTTFLVSGQSVEMDGLKITASAIGKDSATLSIG